MKYILHFSILLLLVCNRYAYAIDDTVVVCSSNQDIQKCVDSIESGTIRLRSNQIYITNGVNLKSNITLIIPKGTIIKLSDSANLNHKAFGGVSNAVISAKGTQDIWLENVHVVLNGEIDGNKEAHPYERGGCEGINFAWIRNSSIQGEGLLHSANGDGCSGTLILAT